MRHFLQLPHAIAGLSRRMPLPTAQRPLVSLPCFAHALSAAYRSALTPAKRLPPVAAIAQLHLLAAETALKKPIYVVDRWPRPADLLALS